MKNTFLYSLIISLLSITFVWPSNAQAQDTVLVDKIIAVVGNKMIKLSEVENMYLQYKMQNQPGQASSKCEVFEQLLLQKLMLIQAEIDSIEVGELEVDMELDRRLGFLQQQMGSDRQLDSIYGKPLAAIKQDLRENIEDQLITERMQREITGEVKVTPSEINQYFEDIPEARRPLINASVEYYQIVIKPEISREQKRLIREDLNEIREKILSGKSTFCRQAAIYSEDPGSKDNCGEIGLTPRMGLDPNFAAAAFGLKHTDSISPVVESEFGYHILQLIERKGDMINVRHILRTPDVMNSARQKARKELDSIRTAILADSLSFEEAASRHSDDEYTRNNGGLAINPYTGDSKFETGHLDARTRIELKSLEKGEISKLFLTHNDRGQEVYKIIMLKSSVEAHVANLDDDYKFIQELALANKKQTVINEWVAEKQQETYIRIDQLYRHCNFAYKGWLK